MRKTSEEILCSRSALLGKEGSGYTHSDLRSENDRASTRMITSHISTGVGRYRTDSLNAVVVTNARTTWWAHVEIVVLGRATRPTAPGAYPTDTVAYTVIVINAGAGIRTYIEVVVNSRTATWPHTKLRRE